MHVDRGRLLSALEQSWSDLIVFEDYYVVWTWSRSTVGKVRFTISQIHTHVSIRQPHIELLRMLSADGTQLASL